MRLKKPFFLSFLLLLVVCSGFFAFQLGFPLTPATPQVMVIAPGTSTHGIARRLEQEGVIRSALIFRILARLRGDSLDLQSGEYRFGGAANVLTVLQRLRHGDVVLHRLTIPEGLRSDEVLALLAKQTDTSVEIWKQAYQGILGGREGEGLLLPETYTYRKPLDVRQVLIDMLRAQTGVLRLLLDDVLHTRELRIIASIIEKETAIDAERPLIAAVIRNRLQRGMALQMDPTVIYGLWREDAAFSGNIRKRDLKRDTAWNTYTRKGLPPTPICNPGKASLRAAAHPADVDYLYFVADGSGGHAFAATLAEHNRNVRRWINIERRK
ncbi:MAG: endolytic transglycosylase MltG [Mariprofundaceae bacterium]|nr:endolytic transglycosylase MltG [Mariprofundaceae bacterium]